MKRERDEEEKLTGSPNGTDPAPENMAERRLEMAGHSAAPETLPVGGLKRPKLDSEASPDHANVDNDGSAGPRDDREEPSPVSGDDEENGRGNPSDPGNSAGPPPEDAQGNGTHSDPNGPAENGSDGPLGSTDAAAPVTAAGEPDRPADGETTGPGEAENGDGNGTADAPGGKGSARALPRPTEKLSCPRCLSEDTKFCYYNNYSITQPRWFCRTCKRYWTAGGNLRNVTPGSGKRKNRFGSAHEAMINAVTKKSHLDTPAIATPGTTVTIMPNGTTTIATHPMDPTSFLGAPSWPMGPAAQHPMYAAPISLGAGWGPMGAPAGAINPLFAMGGGAAVSTAAQTAGAQFMGYAQHHHGQGPPTLMMMHGQPTAHGMQQQQQLMMPGMDYWSTSDPASAMAYNQGAYIAPGFPQTYPMTMPPPGSAAPLGYPGHLQQMPGAATNPTTAQFAGMPASYLPNATHPSM